MARGVGGALGLPERVLPRRRTSRASLTAKSWPKSGVSLRSSCGVERGGSSFLAVSARAVSASRAVEVAASLMRLNTEWRSRRASTRARFREAGSRPPPCAARVGSMSQNDAHRRDTGRRPRLGRARLSGDRLMRSMPWPDGALSVDADGFGSARERRAIITCAAHSRSVNDTCATRSCAAVRRASVSAARPAVPKTVRRRRRGGFSPPTAPSTPRGKRAPRAARPRTHTTAAGLAVAPTRRRRSSPEPRLGLGATAWSRSPHSVAGYAMVKWPRRRLSATRRRARSSRRRRSSSTSPAPRGINAGFFAFVIADPCHRRAHVGRPERAQGEAQEGSAADGACRNLVAFVKRLNFEACARQPHVVRRTSPS